MRVFAIRYVSTLSVLVLRMLFLRREDVLIGLITHTF